MAILTRIGLGGFSHSSALWAPTGVGELFNISMLTDLSEWTTNIGSAVWVSGGLGGTTGAARITGIPFIDTGLVKSFPAITTNDCTVRFYASGLTSIVQADGDAWQLCALYKGANIALSANRKVFIVVHQTLGVREIGLYVVDDAGVTVQTAHYPITTEPSYYQVRLKKATSAVTADGTAELYFDGVLKETLTGLNVFTDFSYTDFLARTSTFQTGMSGAYTVDEVVGRDDAVLPGAVAPPNTAPVVTNPGTQYGAVGVGRSIRITLSDPENNIATVRFQSTLANGTVDVSGTAGTVVSAGARGSNDFTLVGSHVQCVAAAQLFFYTGLIQGNDAGVTVTANDGTLSDSTVFAVQSGLALITAANQVDANATLAGMGLLVPTTGPLSLTMKTIDAAGLIDEDVTLVSVAAFLAASSGGTQSFTANLVSGSLLSSTVSAQTTRSSQLLIGGFLSSLQNTTNISSDNLVSGVLLETSPQYLNQLSVQMVTGTFLSLLNNKNLMTLLGDLTISKLFSSSFSPTSFQTGDVQTGTLVNASRAAGLLKGATLVSGTLFNGALSPLFSQQGGMITPVVLRSHVSGTDTIVASMLPPGPLFTSNAPLSGEVTGLLIQETLLIGSDVTGFQSTGDVTTGLVFEGIFGQRSTQQGSMSVGVGMETVNVFSLGRMGELTVLLGLSGQLLVFSNAILKEAIFTNITLKTST